MLGIFIWAALNLGDFGRDHERLNEIYRLKSSIPIGSKIFVCDKDMKSFSKHAYYQRYMKWGFTKSLDQADFIIWNSECGIAPSIDKEAIPITQLESLNLFKIIRLN